MSSAAILEKAKTTLADATNATINVTALFRSTPLIEYEPVSATTSMSANMPRFGHTREFATLFYSSDAPEQVAARQDYWEGLLFVAAFVLAVFVTWSLLLGSVKILWTFCGGHHTDVIPSYLAGQPFTLRDDEPTKDQVSKFNSSSSRKRIVFLTAASLLILFAILLVSKGFQQVEATRATADHSLDDVRVLIDDATDLTIQLKEVGITASTLRDQLVQELGKDRLCPNDPNYLAQDEIGKSINDNSKAAIDMLEVLGEFATNDIGKMQQGLTKADQSIDAIDTLVEEVAKQQWIGIAFVLPLVFLTALLMVGAMAAQGRHINGISQFLLSYVILPIFVVWTVMSYLFCSGLAVSASANADFCAGGADQSPDSTILAALLNAGLQETDSEYQIARYYLRQCTANAEVDPFLFLRRHEAEIISAQGIVQELSASLEKIDVETLSFQCGRDFQPLRSSVDTMTEILESLEQSAISGLDLLSCERIVPVYAEIVYEGTCNHSVTGFTWMFASLLVIATMGTTMIMLRSSYLNNLILADENDPTDEDSEFNQMHQLANRRHRSKVELEADAYDLQLQEHKRWKENVTKREDTSDSGSVYTDGNGDLIVVEVDPSDYPYMMNDAPSYDRYGRPKPTAPMGPVQPPY